MPAANRLTLDATLGARDVLRRTPVGLPVLSMTLVHASEQPEGGGKRNVECELAAVAFGAVAESIASLPVGSTIRCEGFLARRYRTGTTLALHIAQFESKERNEKEI